MEEFNSVQIGARSASSGARTGAEVPSRDVQIEVKKRESLDLANNQENGVSALSLLSSEMALEISRSMEQALNKSSTRVQFRVKADAEGVNPITFRVINENTGEVLREFPSEEVQKIAKNAREQTLQGLMVDSVV
ncbi:MAG TPA: flagellar protein FlaG [Oligoflexia bacterium]|nr:flagellar protein FlaG [Oligoflexia bacterium]HMP47637.1 flagellar protein FlaG [Oligoflexia bacterium]